MYSTIRGGKVNTDLGPRIHQLTVEQIHEETDLQELQQRSNGKADGLLAGNVAQLPTIGRRGRQRARYEDPEAHLPVVH